MSNEEVIKFMEKKQPANSLVKINFKVRSSISGMFIKTADYDELSRKNLWRIVNASNVDAYKKNNDINLCRIFNGAEFTKLEMA